MNTDDLPVPDEAFTAMYDLVMDVFRRGGERVPHLPYPMDEEGVSALVRAIVKPCMAAELRRLADEAEQEAISAAAAGEFGRASCCDHAAYRFRAAADALHSTAQEKTDAS